jgi:hypothetical protein
MRALNDESTHFLPKLGQLLRWPNFCGTLSKAKGRKK